MTAPPTTTGSESQERREFVRAYSEHLWMRPREDRPMVKLRTVVMLAALTAAATLASGVGLHLLRPHDGAKAVAATVPAVLNYTAVAGWDCGIDGSHGFDAAGKTPQWYTVATGGWSRDGCIGAFEALPMSGNSTKPTDGQNVTWWFSPGQQFNRCTLYLWSPTISRRQDSSATAVHLAVLASRNGSPIAEVTVDQVHSPGGWLSLGNYPVGTDGIAVRLDNSGVPVVAGGRVAATQVRADCRN